jgi:uncharacterized protein YecT (DUF1311 family)
MRLKIVGCVVVAMTVSSQALAFPAIESQLDSNEFKSCIQNEPSEQCFMDEADRQDKVLNIVYKRVMATLSPSDRHQLILDERAWLKRLGEVCTNPDPTGTSLDDRENTWACFTSETEKRTIYLGHMLPH